MSRVGAFVEDFFAHYASEYYDPAKAREYYLRNRELKNKRSVSDLTVKYQEAGKGRGKDKGKLVTRINREATDRKKQAWAYASNQISEERKAQLEALSIRRKQVVDKARKSSQVRRKEISTKLTNLLKLLTDKRTASAESIDADEQAALQKVEEKRAAKAREIRERAYARIDAIPPVPKGASGAQRERLLAARDKRIARINGDATRDIDSLRKNAAAEREVVSADADTERQALSTQTMKEKESGRGSAKANRETVVRSLKATVDKARADYEAGKERLIAEYEAKSQKEFDAIRTRV